MALLLSTIYIQSGKALKTAFWYNGDKQCRCYTPTEATLTANLAVPDEHKMVKNKELYSIKI